MRSSVGSWTVSAASAPPVTPPESPIPPESTTSTSLPRRSLPEGWFRQDLILTVVLALAAVEMTYLMAGAGMTEGVFQLDVPWVALGAALLALPVLTRRRWPAASAVVMSAAYIGLAIFVGIELYASQVMLFLTFYAVGAWDPHRRRAFITRLAIAVIMGAWLVGAAIQGFYDPEFGERGVNAYLSILGIQLATNIAYFSAAWIFGNRAYQQAIEREELQSAHAEIRDQQDQLRRNAVELERMRIARELHDVVAHHVTAMGIQAAAGRRLVTRDPEAAEAQLKGVEGSAREAIVELQSMVRTLRSGDDSDDRTPTLRDLDGLIEQARQMGQQVHLHRVEELPELSPAAELTVYRVIQEALTNARKHAGPLATVDVRLRGRPDRVEVEVSDTGRGQPAGRPLGTGMGVQGMRERLDSVGGALEAGPRPRLAGDDLGGWLVRAAVPARGAAPLSQSSAAPSAQTPEGQPA